LRKRWSSRARMFQCPPRARCSTSPILSCSTGSASTNRLRAALRLFHPPITRLRRRCLEPWACLMAISSTRPSLPPAADLLLVRVQILLLRLRRTESLVAEVLSSARPALVLRLANGVLPAASRGSEPFLSTLTNLAPRRRAGFGSYFEFCHQTLSLEPSTCIRYQHGPQDARPFTTTLSYDAPVMKIRIHDWRRGLWILLNPNLCYRIVPFTCMISCMIFILPWDLWLVDSSS
jgi:hypothetical protein